MSATVQLDVISDTICPWCFIGKRRLEKALALRPDVTVYVRWRPYQLDPTIPAGGVDRREYMDAKFGGPQRASEIYESIRQAGAEEDLPFAFDRIRRTPNTINSHRLIRWGATANCQDAVVERLFRLYFFEGGDIEDIDALVSVAEQSGMDADLVAELMPGDADVDLVEREIGTARDIGVTGVPCFVFANSFGVMGAQAPEVLADGIDRALAEPADTAGT